MNLPVVCSAKKNDNEWLAVVFVVRDYVFRSAALTRQLFYLADLYCVPGSSLGACLDWVLFLVLFLQGNFVSVPALFSVLPVVLFHVQAVLFLVFESVSAEVCVVRFV